MQIFFCLIFGTFYLSFFQFFTKKICKIRKNPIYLPANFFPLSINQAALLEQFKAFSLNLLTKQVGNKFVSLSGGALYRLKHDEILSQTPARVALGTHSKGCAANQRRGLFDKIFLIRKRFVLSGE